MKTIKIYLNEDGSIRDYTQDFVINQYSFQDSLINVYVPTSILDLRNTNTTIEDEDTGATITTINGTDVQMGLIYTNPNGTTRVGDGYLFNFVKSNIIVNNVNYTLFERLMPKEFSLYAGENNYALNVVNVRTINTTLNGETTTESFTTSLITSATYHLYITASANFDTTTEETTDLENIQAQVNGIADDLALKQDKEDSTINVYTDSTHTQTTNNVVEGLNDLNTRVGSNESDLATLKPQVQANTEDIARLENQIICDAIYVGSITANTEPNATTLTNFVISEGFELKAGDIVIWTYQISGATDKSYKCMYGASGWGWYEIPPIESASNGTKGLVTGTWRVDNYNTLVDIVDGKIRGIYVKRYGSPVYDEIATLSTRLYESIANIINGTQSVGNATYATYDESERNNAVKTPISSKYATPSQVASAIQDYALPKIFNDVYYFNFTSGEMVSDYQELPTTTSTNIDLSNIGQSSAISNNLPITDTITITNKTSMNVNLYVDNTNLVNDSIITMAIYAVKNTGNADETFIMMATAKLYHGESLQKVELSGLVSMLGLNELTITPDYHLQIGFFINNEYSNNGSVNLMCYKTLYQSTFLFSLPYGSLQLSEAKKGEKYYVSATASVINNQVVLDIPQNEFDISGFTSTDHIELHITATLTAPDTLSTAITPIYALINGIISSIYSQQINSMILGYFGKAIKSYSRDSANDTITIVFDFDAVYNNSTLSFNAPLTEPVMMIKSSDYTELNINNLLRDDLVYIDRPNNAPYLVDDVHDFTFNGEIYHTGTLYADGEFYANDMSEFNGDTNFYGNNTFEGDSTFEGDVDLEGTLTLGANAKQTIVNLIYPVGSIYMSVNDVNPSTLFGGTWAKLEDRFLLGSGSTYTNGATGGEANHTLTIDEMPSHTHNMNGWQGAQGTGVWLPNAPSAQANVVSTESVQPTGGSQPHNNMPPYLVVNMWKRTA